MIYRYYIEDIIKIFIYRYNIMFNNMSNSKENRGKKEVAGANINLIGNKCYRCGHEWLPRNKNSQSRVCPKCKSPYWDRPKK